MSPPISTTEERIEFVRRSIKQRRELANALRGQAIGNTVTEAAQCLKLAELAEAYATAQERTLLILFP